MKLALIIFLLNIFSIALVCSELNADQQQEIIDKINNVRRNTVPPAANMREVQWNECYAQIALDFLKKCGDVDGHNPDRFTQGCEASENLGESIYNRPLDDTTTDPIGVWAKEGESYNYYERSCSGPTCINYLQLINANAYLVGCAVYNQENCGRTGETTICNYGEGLGFTGATYNEGEPCSECEGEFSYCNEGLCAQEDEPTPTGSTSTGSTNEVTDCPTNHHHHNHNHDHDHNHDHKNHDHGKGGGKGKGKGKGKGEGKGEGDDEGISGFLGVYAEDKSDATSNSIMILLLVATILSVLLSSL
ncbi:Peptidase inhibitor 15-like isoform X2 [Oopsacas minuta]|uniref:Peptidase inhibitor 15-like isoform X2 n=1 Tax=Oopsacas minuta TaxID=111878 RepID=A0AAV7K9D3_9METZ|nr:Peptidase inhibitor 15-like isoform X2 [Oopsacas minuta]